MEIIIEKKHEGCDAAFWSIEDVHNNRHPGKEWKQAKLDCCIDLGYTKTLTKRKTGETKVIPKVPNTKSANVKLAKLMEDQGCKTKVVCRWGFHMNTFQVSV